MPFAYGLRDHVVFTSPIKIDRSKTVRRSVQDSWKKKIETGSADFLPLVQDAGGGSPPGWVSYGNTLEGSPEIEVICGGDNAKTPDGAAVWREGNLLHFGFEPSPADLNEAGRALLVNSIIYIARFREDRPIARTRSPFAGAALRSRESLGKWLDNEEYPVEFFTNVLSEATREAAHAKTRGEWQTWFAHTRPFLRMDADGKLVIDEEVRALGVHYDEPAFFEQAIAALKDPGKAAAARAVLSRFAPDGPGREAAADEWAAWYKANAPYLFFTEWGGYRWYIDPLARKRGVPSAQLRGPARADRATSAAAPASGG